MTDTPSRPDLGFVSFKDPETCWRDEKALSVGYFGKRVVTRVDESLLSEIRDEAVATAQNVRMSLHHGPDEALHEMIIHHHGDKYYRPKKHIDKAKSFHVLEGITAVVTFADDGEIIDASVLDKKNSFMCRVEPGYYHCEIPLTEYCTFHETTLGPFNRETDRVYAPWAPKVEEDFQGASAFRERLLKLFGPDWPAAAIAIRPE